MNINNRLKKIADFVPEQAKVMDIGCDHALLDIYLVKHKNISKCVASDVAASPLEAALKNITTYQVKEKIETRLGNGLDVYTEDLDTIIISGLGGKTMQGIFNKHLEYLRTVSTIILSPNNYQMDIKKFLCRHGYYIEDEVFIQERKIIYQIIQFKKGKKRYSSLQYFFGPILLQRKGQLFLEFYRRELKSREILLTLLPHNYYLKRWKTKKEIKQIKRALEK